MTRTVTCVLLRIPADGLDYQPYPGELGKRIYENVSKEGWQRWVKHQTMLLNEYRLTPVDPKARRFLLAETVELPEAVRLAEQAVGADGVLELTQLALDPKPVLLDTGPGLRQARRDPRVGVDPPLGFGLIALGKISD